MRKSLLFVLLTCAACHSYDPAHPPRDPFSDEFRTYTGEQNWKTATGSFCRNVKGVPIYYTFPDRAYDVLGSVTIPEQDEEGLVRCALAHRADAVFIGNIEHETVGFKHDPGLVFGGPGWAVSAPGKDKAIERNSVTAYIIKFHEPKP